MHDSDKTTQNTVQPSSSPPLAGRDGDYGVQRAWGTVGWGVMGPLAGVLIDYWSGTSITKNYAPAFILSFILGCADVIVSAIFINVSDWYFTFFLFITILSLSTIG